VEAELGGLPRHPDVDEPPTRDEMQSDVDGTAGEPETDTCAIS
jgi:hypothetical protein